MLKRQDTIPTTERPPLGDALRQRRKELGLSMQAVADQAGLSVGFISQVERGISAPSLGSLTSIAGILEIPLSALLDQPQASTGQTLRAARQTFAIAEDELSYERLSTRFNHSQLNALIVHEPPGHRYEPISHPGEELFYMLSGTITIEIEGDRHVLGPGDSIHFDSHRTHSSWNHGDQAASFLWCGTVDVFGDKPSAIPPLHQAPVAVQSDHPNSQEQ